MSNASSLNVDIGCTTQAGIKTINEDSADFVIPEQDYALKQKGVSCVLADGVSSAEAGQQASQQSVSNFLADYFNAPDTWSVKHTGQQILSATNLSLFKQSHQFHHEQKGYLCTFVGLVLKSQTAHFFHVGDSRLYLLRQGKFTQLTQDHSATIAKDKSYLTRALGMDNNLHIDYGKQTIELGDVFLLTTDGIHDFIKSDKIIEVLNQTTTPQQKAELLTKQALNNGSDDNLSCIICQVNNIANESLDDLNAKLTRLPFPPILEPGMKLDGFLIEKELFASSRSQLYLVKDLITEQTLVMKTPSINFAQDTHYIDRFIQEEWIGKRLNSDKVVKIINQDRPRTCLYYLMEYVEGNNLSQWMTDNPFPSPKVAINIIKQISQGLQAFHDKDTIHQDLKPANIIINQQHQVKVVDFGSTFVAGAAEVFSPLEHQGALGTASYADPQYLLGKNTGIQGDLYSLATICYELFTGQLPYGEKIEQCQSAFEYDHLRYVSANYHNPVIPIWFDRALEKGVQINPEKRYQRLEQLLEDLTQPNPTFLLDVPEDQQKQSKITFWLFLSAFWVFMMIVVAFMFQA